MVQTVPRKRIEILVDTPLVPRIVSKLKALDISGWSVIHMDSGGGRGGRMAARRRYRHQCQDNRAGYRVRHKNGAVNGRNCAIA